MPGAGIGSGMSRVVVGDRSLGHRSVLSAYLPVAAVAVLLGFVPVVIGDSRTYMGLAITALTFGAYACGFNVIFGSTGQLFLCLGALAGVGGYGSALLADRADLPFLVTIPMAAAIAAVVGGVFSWISVRRSLGVIFTGIVTLTFSLGFGNLLLGQRDLTGGETGLLIAASQDTFLRDLVPAYYVFLGMLIGYLLLFRWLQRSHFGWAFRALRDDEMTAELAGIDVARFRVWAGLIGSAMLGLVGAIHAHHNGFINPTTFEFGRVDVRTLVILAFGGIGTLMGPVIGTVSFAVVDELIRDLRQLRIAVEGGILIVLFLGFRGGVGPAVVSLYHRFRARTGRTGS